MASTIWSRRRPDFLVVPRDFLVSLEDGSWSETIGGSYKVISHCRHQKELRMQVSCSKIVGREGSAVVGIQHGNIRGIMLSNVRFFRKPKI